MTIESILKRKGTDVTTIAPEASIKRAADWLSAKNIGALVVVTSEDTVLGLISEREIVHAFSRYGETAGSMPVNPAMLSVFAVRAARSLDPQAALDELNKMRRPKRASMCITAKRAYPHWSFRGVSLLPSLRGVIIL